MKSKKLTLKKPLSLTQQAKIYQALGFPFGQEKKKQREENKRKAAAFKKTRLRDAVSWLVTTYSKCFNPQNPKPLKIGIDKDILLQGEWPHSKTFLRKVLAFYIGSPYYQHALLKEKKRISLEGRESEEITDYQREVAEERLKKIETRKNRPRNHRHSKKQKLFNSYKSLLQNEPDNQNA